MIASPVRIAAFAAALAVLSVPAAFAESSAPSAFALPDPALALAAVAPADAGPQLDLVQASVPDVQMAGVHYRPRRSGWGNRAMDSQSVTQLHLGFFDPHGDAGRQFLVGLRGGPMIDPNIQLGVGVDWAHLADNVSSVTQTSSGPTGVSISTQHDVSRSSSNLFPIMAYVQVSADDKMTIIPYVGLGGGYEVMNLTADNYQTNASFDATYGGWGWEAWGGASYALSGRARVSAELFVNTADLGRDVTDTTGTYRETVNANGFGMRLGIAWGF